MNGKGIIYTLMTVLVIIAIVSLVQVILEKRRESHEVFEAVQLIDVKNYYTNIENDIVDLAKTGLRKDMAERVLPFSYNIDGNRIALQQELSLKQNVWSQFFDLVNIYAIFVSDRNFENAYSGLAVDANTVRNKDQNAWGGNDDNIQFLIEPFCTGFVEEKDGNIMLIGRAANPHCNDYNFRRIKMVDVNIIVKMEAEDYNSIVWDRNDSGTDLPNPANCSSGCPNQDYNGQANYLYYRFFFSDGKCINCLFPAGTQKTIREQIPYDSKISIKVSCTGSNCVSDEINFVIDNGILISHLSNEMVDANVSVQFDANISRFSFLDFNYSVSGKDFNAFKTNNPKSFN